MLWLLLLARIRRQFHWVLASERKVPSLAPAAWDGVNQVWHSCSGWQLLRPQQPTTPVLTLLEREAPRPRWLDSWLYLVEQAVRNQWLDIPSRVREAREEKVHGLALVRWIASGSWKPHGSIARVSLWLCLKESRCRPSAHTHFLLERQHSIPSIHAAWY